MVNLGLANDLISIQPEVLYSQKDFKYAGQSYTVLGNTYRNTGSGRYDYLDVPLLLRLKVSGVFFEVGPQYSYLLNILTDRTQTYNGSVVGTAGSGTSNLDNVNRKELGYVGGVGFQSSQDFLLGCATTVPSPTSPRMVIATMISKAPATRLFRSTWAFC